jgi:hypothetical protein
VASGVAIEPPNRVSKTRRFTGAGDGIAFLHGLTIFVWLAGQDSLHADQRSRDESSANFHPDRVQQRSSPFTDKKEASYALLCPGRGAAFLAMRSIVQYAAPQSRDPRLSSRQR